MNNAEEVRAATRAQMKSVITADLKTDINQFLWQKLPPEVTIGHADEIATRWAEELHNLWDKK